MAQESFATVVKRRLLGVLLIAVVAALITLSIAIYNKAFTTYVPVTLRADHTGNQLIIDSDVKERGIIVGSVKSVQSKGDGAIVRLNLDPSRVKDIPSNVKAQILPKTLFGEQYVSLIYPTNPTEPIKAGDTIPQDRSKGALETEKVLGDLLPLLTAVSPADVNATLTAVATALSGRGDKLGQTLINMDRYLTSFNPHVKQLVDDLAQLGKVSLEYNDLAPDIVTSLKNLQVSAKTILTRQQALDSLLVSGTSASNVLKGFLNANEGRLIEVTGQTTKIYSLLDQYSPEFTCLFAGVNHTYELAAQAVYNHQIHLTVTADANKFQAQPYKPGQEPRLLTGIGPNCFGLPNNIAPLDSKGHFQIPDKFKCLNDGAALTQAGESKNCSTSSSTADERSVNSAEENALVNTLIANQLHTTPAKVPGVATLLAGPLLRGQQVVVK
jgi:phospholipid/cholesterol/gamma-HCH transport system substrate-binding protein